MVNKRELFMMKTEQRQIVWMELYLAVVKCCEEGHLGSVTRTYNSSGTAVFSAEYDPWGVQTVTTNTIGYRSALCDAFIAKWRKNYVQLPTSAQSFNRYSYCLNNPLKYVDPEGEYYGIDDLIAALVGDSINVIVHVFSGDIHSFGQGAALFGVGALAGGFASYFSLGTLSGPAFVGGEVVGSIGGSWAGSNIGGWVSGVIFDLKS